MYLPQHLVLFLDLHPRLALCCLQPFVLHRGLHHRSTFLIQVLDLKAGFQPRLEDPWICPP